MKKITFFLITSCAVSAWAAAPAIGSVEGIGEFRLNQAATRGSGTLFEGSIVETGSARSDISLSSGGHIVMAPNSKTRFFSTKAVLESGAAEMSGRNITLVAAKLSISGSSAQVVVDSSSKIRVAALSTPVEVRNSSEMLIARLSPGTALEFDQGGAPNEAVSVTGLVTRDGSDYFISDQTTKVKYQLQGSCTGLEKFVNKTKLAKVEGSLVSGVTPRAGATAVIGLSAKSCVVAEVAAAGAAGVGLSTAAIAGIAVAGATAGIVGGLAAAGTFSDASAK